MSLFISHSRHDEEIVNYFVKAIARVSITPILVELEDMGTKYAGYEVSNMIKNQSVGVAVLLGQSLESPPSDTPEYTHNWVSFEVGVANGSGKPIWVFEQFGADVFFPVPYLTDYIQYELNNPEHLRYVGDILKNNLTARCYQPPRFVKCPYANCNAVYNYWNGEQDIICPACRQTMTFQPPQFQQGIRGRYLYFPSNTR